MQPLLALAAPAPSAPLLPMPAPLALDAQDTASNEPQLDLIPPASGGTVTDLPGGIRIWASADAELAVEKPTELALGSPRNTATQSVLLSAGELRVQVNAVAGAETALLVRTPGRAAFVVQSGRGVALVRGKTATFAALAGRMLTGVGRQWRALKQGATLSFAAASQQGLPGTLPAAPSVTLDRKLATAVGREAIPFQVHLDGPAQRHRVSLLRVAEDGPQKITEEETSSRDLTLSCPQPGTYWVAVWPIAAHGIAGPAASLQRLLVVGLVLPEASALEASTASVVNPEVRSVTLRPGQNVEILNARELEMSYGTPRYFAPAPNYVSLAGASETAVWLRAVGSSENLALRLVPSVLNAVVSLDPHNAIWPGKKVLARVRFLDASGQLAPETQTAQLNVSINTRPTKVSWRRSKDALESWIAQPHFPGPWVIRVEVLDSERHMLGRNFLEVAAAKSASQ